MDTVGSLGLKVVGGVAWLIFVGLRFCFVKAYSFVQPMIEHIYTKMWAKVDADDNKVAAAHDPAFWLILSMALALFDVLWLVTDPHRYKALLLIGLLFAIGYFSMQVGMFLGADKQEQKDRLKKG